MNERVYNYFQHLCNLIKTLHRHHCVSKKTSPALLLALPPLRPFRATVTTCGVLVIFFRDWMDRIVSRMIVASYDRKSSNSLVQQ